jgi:tetratricopeptide (TPR) repeat protein
MRPTLTIQNISHLLHAPQSNTAYDAQALNDIKEKYPYFIPAHYIHAAQLSLAGHDREQMLSQMQLHMGNWLLFNQYIQSRNANDIAFDKLSTDEVVTQPFYIEEPIPAPAIEPDPIPNPIENIAKNINVEKADFNAHKVDDGLISPIFSEDYFLHQGIQVSNAIPKNLQEDLSAGPAEEEDKSLMVVMSFSEWLLHFKTRSQKEKEEREDQKALKTMWQKEKLAAALEEENEEIPENVFEMAVNSITREEGLVSEALADVYEKQGKHDKAIDMYRKLSLRNPQKNAYFARKIENIQKEKEL